MQFKRFAKSLLNNILFIINAILWIFSVKSLGEIATGITAGKNRKDRFIYGLCSLLQYILYATIIAMILTIYWWARNEASIAERISGIDMK